MKHILLLMAAWLACLPPASAQTAATQDAPALTTVVVDRTVRLSLTGVAPGCRLLRIALLRRDALAPGYGAFIRPVRVDQALGRVVSLVLGPELQPYRYPAGDIRLSCYDAGGRITQELASSVPLALDQPVLLFEISKSFGPIDVTP